MVVYSMVEYCPKLFYVERRQYREQIYFTITLLDVLRWLRRQCRIFRLLISKENFKANGNTHFY